MKVDLKKIDAVRRELRFEIPKERVARSLDEVYTEIAKVAKVKGFRQGKVPHHILKTHHGDLAREELIKKLIPQAYQEGISQHNIKPMDFPEIREVEFKDGTMTFIAALDIKPEVKIDQYKGIPIKRKETKVTEEEINKTLDYFKESQGKTKDSLLDDAFARGLGYPNLEELKKSLTRQLELDKERHNRLDIDNQISEFLLKSAKLAIPQTLVKRWLERRLNEAREKMRSQGMAQEEISKKIDEHQQEIRDHVERDVRLYLIMDKIAQMENVEVKENESLVAKVMEFLLKEADWGITPS